MGRARRWVWLFSLACSASVPNPGHPVITAPPAGPYRIRANRILDSNGREYLIRGTRLPVISLSDPVDSAGFGPWSGTTLISIRQRLNMNAVRLPVDAREYEANALYRARVKEIVQRVNRFELLAILEPDSSPAFSFWTQCAAAFSADPDVFFALPPLENAPQIIDAIRAAGAPQPVIVSGPPGSIHNSNIVYEVRPSYSSMNEDQKLIDSFSEHFPMIVDGLDPQFERPASECAAFPNDPAQASRLIEDLLSDFDVRAVSWTISAIEPGQLLDNYAGYNWTKLDDGWTCGESPVRGGIGMAVLSHLWGANAHGLITVNQPAGGFVIARGANASAYGRVLAARQERAERQPLPIKLANISIRVRDSRGVARLASLSWTGGGWSSVNFVIPADSAPGPAEVAVVRSDGSRTASEIVIGDVAPGLWTASNDGRGPVIAQVLQRFSDGKTAQFPAWECTPQGCRAVPIPLSAKASTTVRIEGTGFRFASSKAAVHVAIDGISVPVETFGPMPESSRDTITVELPNNLIGRGEVDLLLVADGALSNVVRIHCGAAAR